MVYSFHSPPPSPTPTLSLSLHRCSLLRVRKAKWKEESRNKDFTLVCVCVFFFCVSQEAVWFLSNITAGNQAQVQVKISQVCLSLFLLVQDETGRKINHSDFRKEKGYRPWWCGLL